jgi:putative transposase
MRAAGLVGVVRGKKVRTTVADPGHQRAGDLVNRDFTASRPNRTWVADFTHVAAWSGVVYVAFVVDVYSRAIVGWSAATNKRTPLVLAALDMGLWRRDRAGRPVRGGLVHHSDAGSQGEFNRSSQHLDPGGSDGCEARSRCLRRRRVRGGSGRRIGRCGRRCVHRAVRSRLVRCSGISGG